MLRPLLLPRIKEQHYLTGLRIDGGEVWPFVQVAAIAGQCEVIRMIAPLVLARGDVLDVEDEGTMPDQFEMAILATISCALSDESSQRRVDHG